MTVISADRAVDADIVGTGTVLSGNMWQELEQESEPEPEPELWSKVEPESEPKINNFGSATLLVGVLTSCFPFH